MVKHALQYRPALWLIGLLLLSLALVACGGATEPAPEESVAPPEANEAVEATQEVAVVPETEETEAAAAAATEEVQAAAAATEETQAEVAATEEVQAENLPASVTTASCQTVDIPMNNQIAAISTSDWANGPADAPVTLIEYGDFQ